MKALTFGIKATLAIGAILMWCGFSFGAGVGLWIKWMVN